MFNLRNLISTSLNFTKKALLNGPQTLKTNPALILNSVQQSSFSTFLLPKHQQSTLLSTVNVIKINSDINSRTVTKYSLGKGKRKTVKTVLKRFYRLQWGGWIRTIAGRHRRVYTKSHRRRMRMQQHVLCNSTQSTLLDKMVTNFWRKPKYYVDDPYEPYHTREEYQYTYRKPKPYYPPE